MNQIQKNLLSLASEKTWEELNEEQKRELINKVKADAAVKLIQANQCVESKNVVKAKELLIHIGDSCAYIKEPDEQILKWYEFSCNYLAILHKRLVQKESKNVIPILEDWDNKDSVLVLKYNKFSGQFEFQKNLPSGQVTHEVLQHVSKLNSIIFGFNNSENNHSLAIILDTYWVPFLITLILVILMVTYLGVYLKWLNLGTGEENWALYPLLALGLIFLAPIVMVFAKQPRYHDDSFFQKKLGEQIKKINEQLMERQIKITFKMPYGSQINVIIERSKKQLSNQVDNNESQAVEMQLPKRKR